MKIYIEFASEYLNKPQKEQKMSETAAELMERIETLVQKIGELVEEARNYACSARESADSAASNANDAQHEADKSDDYCIDANTAIKELYEAVLELRTKLKDQIPQSDLDADISKHRRDVMQRHEAGMTEESIADALDIAEVLVSTIVSKEMAEA